jgi:hypothetical protein
MSQHIHKFYHNVDISDQTLVNWRTVSYTNINRPVLTTLVSERGQLIYNTDSKTFQISVLNSLNTINVWKDLSGSSSDTPGITVPNSIGTPSSVPVPERGATVYNTSSGFLQVWNGTEWVNVGSGGGGTTSGAGSGNVDSTSWNTFDLGNSHSAIEQSVSGTSGNLRAISEDGKWFFVKTTTNAAIPGTLFKIQNSTKNFRSEYGEDIEEDSLGNKITDFGGSSHPFAYLHNNHEAINSVPQKPGFATAITDNLLIYGNKHPTKGIIEFSKLPETDVNNISRIVSVGSNTTNKISYSNDGNIWNGSGKDVFSDINIGKGVTGTSSILVATGRYNGTSSIVKSTDSGVNWTAVTTGADLFKTVGNGVAHQSPIDIVINRGNGSPVGTGSQAAFRRFYIQNDTVPNKIWQKDFNASGWTEITHAVSPDGVLDGIVGDYMLQPNTNQVYINILDTGTKSWTEVLDSWVAVGKGENEIIHSFDGLNWSAKSSNNKIFSEGKSVAFDKNNINKVVAVGKGENTFSYSIDRGLTWIGGGSNDKFGVSGNSVIGPEKKYYLHLSGSNIRRNSWSTDLKTMTDTNWTVTPGLLVNPNDITGLKTADYDPNKGRWVIGGSGNVALMYNDTPNGTGGWTPIPTSTVSESGQILASVTQVIHNKIDRWTAVGQTTTSQNGCIYSFDGINWLPCVFDKININKQIYTSVGYGTGINMDSHTKYWVIGFTSGMYRSRNGIDWEGTSGSLLFGSNTIGLIEKILFDGYSNWWAIGNDSTNRVIRSTDNGINWSTFITIGNDILFASQGTQDMAYSPILDRLVVIGITATVGTGRWVVTYTSGGSIRPYINIGSNLVNPSSVTWTGSEFIVTCLSSNVMKISYDGETWLDSEISVGGSYMAINKVTNWVAVGRKSTTSSPIAYNMSINSSIFSSGDGITWTRPSSLHQTATETLILSLEKNDIAYGINKWVMVGKDEGTTASIAYSYDLAKWLNIGDTTSTIVFDIGYGIAHNGTNRWVAVGKGENTIAYSADGIGWVPVENSKLIFGLKGTSVTWNGSKFIATGEGLPTDTGILTSASSSTATSSDGITWTPLSTTDPFKVIGYGKNLYKNKWDVLFSTDDIEVYKDGLWVCLGTGANTIGISRDGINWGSPNTSNVLEIAANDISFLTNSPLPLPTSPAHIEIKSIWVAVGEGESSMYWSEDIENWTPVTQEYFNGLSNVATANSNDIFSIGHSVTNNKNGKLVQAASTTNTVTKRAQGPIWVAVGEGRHTIAFSRNGKQWWPVGNSKHIFAIRGKKVIHTGERFIAIGDGTTFNGNTSPTPLYPFDTINRGSIVPTGIIKARKYTFFILTATSTTYQNTDGDTTWAVVSGPPGGVINGVAGDIYINILDGATYVNTSGTIIVPTTTWNTQPPLLPISAVEGDTYHDKITGINYKLETGTGGTGIIPANNTFWKVITGKGTNTMAYSIDGKQWFPITGTKEILEVANNAAYGFGNTGHWFVGGGSTTRFDPIPSNYLETAPSSTIALSNLGTSSWEVQDGSTDAFRRREPALNIGYACWVNSSTDWRVGGVGVNSCWRTITSGSFYQIEGQYQGFVTFGTQQQLAYRYANNYNSTPLDVVRGIMSSGSSSDNVWFVGEGLHNIAKTTASNNTTGIVSYVYPNRHTFGVRGNAVEYSVVEGYAIAVGEGDYPLLYVGGATDTLNESSCYPIQGTEKIFTKAAHCIHRLFTSSGTQPWVVGGEKIVQDDGGSILAYSTDQNIWTPCSVGTNLLLKIVYGVYANELSASLKWIAVGLPGTSQYGYITSPDGINWSSPAAVEGNKIFKGEQSNIVLYDIRYIGLSGSDLVWAACGKGSESGNTISRSMDNGVTWEEVPNSGNIFTIAHSLASNRFVGGVDKLIVSGEGKHCVIETSNFEIASVSNILWDVNTNAGSVNDMVYTPHLLVDYWITVGKPNQSNNGTTGPIRYSLNGGTCSTYKSTVTWFNAGSQAMTEGMAIDSSNQIGSSTTGTVIVVGKASASASTIVGVSGVPTGFTNYCNLTLTELKTGYDVMILRPILLTTATSSNNEYCVVVGEGSLPVCRSDNSGNNSWVTASPPAALVIGLGVMWAGRIQSGYDISTVGNHYKKSPFDFENPRLIVVGKGATSLNTDNVLIYTDNFIQTGTPIWAEVSLSITDLDYSNDIAYGGRIIKYGTFTGTGSPHNSLSGNIGLTYQDTVNGDIYTNTNNPGPGKTWALNTSNDRWVMVGKCRSGGTSCIYYSNNNGVDWIRSQAFANDGTSSVNTATILFNEGISVNFNGSTFIATGKGGTNNTIAFSSDGITWHVQKNTSLLSNPLDMATDDETNMIAISSDQMIRSIDNGLSWRSTESRPFPGGTISSIMWDGSKWIATGIDGTVTVSTSIDHGKTWVNVTTSPLGVVNMDWDENTYIHSVVGGKPAVGQSNSLWRSSDGIAWEPCTNQPFGVGTSNNITSPQVNGVLWNQYDRWIALGRGLTSMATSFDGISWTINPTGSAIFTEAYDVAVKYKTLIAVGTGTHTIARSVDDGTTWIGILSSAGTSLFDECFGILYTGNSQWLALGKGISTNTTAVSIDDGQTWVGQGNSFFTTYATKAVWNPSHDIVFALGKGSDTVSYSEDKGRSWTGLGKSLFTDSGNDIAWNGMAHIDATEARIDINNRTAITNVSTYVIVGKGKNTILYSTTGKPTTTGGWTSVINTPFEISGNSVKYTGRMYIATGEGSNSIATSIDGIVWSSIRQSIPDTLSYGNVIAWNYTKSVSVVGYGTAAPGLAGLEFIHSTDGLRWDYGPHFSGVKTTAIIAIGTSHHVGRHNFETDGRGTWVVTLGITTAPTGEASSTRNYMMHSSDGITWHGVNIHGSLLDSTSIGCNGISFNPEHDNGPNHSKGKWVATGYKSSSPSSNFIESIDGSSWTLNTTGENYNIFSSTGGRHLKYANGLWIASEDGLLCRIALSRDGHNWILSDLDVYVNITSPLRCTDTLARYTRIKYINDHWVMFGESGSMTMSKDGVFWYTCQTGMDYPTNDGDYNGNNWIFGQIPTLVNNDQNKIAIGNGYGEQPGAAGNFDNNEFGLVYNDSNTSGNTSFAGTYMTMVWTGKLFLVHSQILTNIVGRFGYSYNGYDWFRIELPEHEPAPTTSQHFLGGLWGLYATKKKSYRVFPTNNKNQSVIVKNRLMSNSPGNTGNYRGTLMSKWGHFINITEDRVNTNVTIISLYKSQNSAKDFSDFDIARPYSTVNIQSGSLSSIGLTMSQDGSKLVYVNYQSGNLTVIPITISDALEKNNGVFGTPYATLNRTNGLELLVSSDANPHSRNTMFFNWAGDKLYFVRGVSGGGVDYTTNNGSLFVPIYVFDVNSTTSKLLFNRTWNIPFRNNTNSSPEHSWQNVDCSLRQGGTSSSNFYTMLRINNNSVIVLREISGQVEQQITSYLSTGNTLIDCSVCTESSSYTSMPTQYMSRNGKYLTFGTGDNNRMIVMEARANDVVSNLNTTPLRANQNGTSTINYSPF